MIEGSEIGGQSRRGVTRLIEDPGFNERFDQINHHYNTEQVLHESCRSECNEQEEGGVL